MTTLRALALAATIALAGACASAAPPTATTPNAAPGTANALVLISGFAFDAQTAGDKTALEVTKGTTVTWSNKDGTTHTVSSGTPPAKDGKFDGQVAAGGSFSFTFADAGTFKYFCAIHNRMTGTITVK